MECCAHPTMPTTNMQVYLHLRSTINFFLSPSLPLPPTLLPYQGKAWKTPSPAKYSSPSRKRQYTPRNTSAEYRGLLELDDGDADIFAPADGDEEGGNGEGGTGAGGSSRTMGTASMLASITEGTEINPIHAAAQHRATASPKTASSGFFSKYNDDANTMSRPILAQSPLNTATTTPKKRGSWFARKTPLRNAPLTPKSYGATEDALAVLPSPGGTFSGASSVSPVSKAVGIMQRAKSFMTRANKPQQAPLSAQSPSTTSSSASASAANSVSNNEREGLSPAPVARKKSWFANTPLGKIRSKGSSARLKAANVEKIQKLGAFRY